MRARDVRKDVGVAGAVRDWCPVRWQVLGHSLIDQKSSQVTWTLAQTGQSTILITEYDWDSRAKSP